MTSKYWIEWIKSRGKKAVAEGSGLTYEAVRQWVAGLTHPCGKNRDNLLEYVRSTSTPEEYSSFRASLADSLLGDSTAKTASK